MCYNYFDLDLFAFNIYNKEERMFKMATTVFGTWEVGKPLGTGTYGKVYEITNHDGTKGAYKVMKIPVELKDSPDSFPKKTQEMCLKEVKRDILGSIKYLQLNDKGKYFASYEDYSFTPSDDFKTLTLKIRMEWLMSLSEITAQTALSEDEILRLAINVCNCLEQCRKMNYVYANLKPNNIFITPKRCKLGDFGNFGYYEPSNMNVSMRKTQEYMAPEMIKFGEINYTSDTYSLGLIMYSLLNNNRLPFIPKYEKTVGINDINTAIEKRCNNYIFPDPDNGSLAIRKIITKACSSSPSARYQSPSEMKEDLLFVLHKQEELSGAYSETEKETRREENSGQAEKNIPSVEGIKTYEYDDSKKAKITLDKKKKILLIAIAVVFAVLVGLIVATFVRDAQPAMITFSPEVILNDYGFGQALFR